MKLAIKPFLCSAIFLGTISSSFAHPPIIPNNLSSSVTSTTFVYGLPFLAIFEDHSLNFGTIAKPTTNVTAKVGFNNQLSGTAQFLDTSTASRGSYKIFGSFFNTINISATDLGTYPQYMKYVKIKGKYPGSGNFNMLQGLGGLAPPGFGKQLKVAAKLKISSGTPDGDYSPEFVISVNYD